MASIDIEVAIDEAAQREGWALQAAWNHKSIFMHKRRGNRNMLSKEEAVFEEKLEERFFTCQCGKMVRLPDDPRDAKPEMCGDCAFLARIRNMQEQKQHLERRKRNRGRRNRTYRKERRRLQQRR